MQLTKKQEEGLKIAIKRYKDGEAYTTIAGYAGTGKSTLIKFIIAALNLQSHQVAYVAYTGKAAQVLRSKGCPNACTAHRLLYRSYEREDGTFAHEPRKTIGPYLRLLVVDEVSMIPNDIWQLMLSHHVHVIALGDPAQLPPVKAVAANVLEHPHIFLDEIMRQAQDSEIIRLTMDIRAHKPLQLSAGSEVKIVTPQEFFVPNFLQWADQIICAKNTTRTMINNQMREAKYGEGVCDLPQEGDKVICLQNNWNVVNAPGDALVNGLGGIIKNIRPNHFLNPCVGDCVMADFYPDIYDDELGMFLDVPMDKNMFIEQKPSENRFNPKAIVPKELKPEQFDYGYSITCHKAQGSEWDKVIVFEEFMRGDNAESHARWLYTAATRAAKQLIIVKNWK